MTLCEWGSPEMMRGVFKAAVFRCFLLFLFCGMNWGDASVGEASNERREAPPAPLGEKVIYKTVGDRQLALYILKPTTASTALRPAIVFFHGGGWRKGAPGLLNDQSEILSQRGIICIQAEYRLIKGDSQPPEVCIEDAISAMRWVRAHAKELGIDPERIGAGGGSAGGHLSAFLGNMSGFDAATDDKSVSYVPQALILFNPVIDNGPQGYGYKLVGERYKEFSPYHNVRKGAPPTLILSGDKDKLVAVPMLKDFQRQMTENGDRCEVVIYPGGGHGFYRKKDANGVYFQPTMDEIQKFLASLGWLEPAAH